MKISVALCTYNGEKYLKDQIDSILQQTHAIDEIVVCDDGSTDKTISILQEYSNNYPSIFKIHKNEINLRSVKNFEKAISLCTGEIIFLSDQDDVWEQNKVEIMVEYFDKNVEIDVICSNGKIINENGDFTDDLTIWCVPNLLDINNIKFDYFNIIAFIENIATGAGMAFRKDSILKTIPFPEKEGFHHDEWIALVSSYDNKFMMIKDELFRYRIHEVQQVGGVTYKNDKFTKNKLINHFNIFSEDKSFLQYKKMIKRLSQSYKKHQDLSTKISHGINISKEIMVRSQDLFVSNKKKMRAKYPIQYFVLKIVDCFTDKRKIS